MLKAEKRATLAIRELLMHHRDFDHNI